MFVSESLQLRSFTQRRMFLFCFWFWFMNETYCNTMNAFKGRLRENDHCLLGDFFLFSLCIQFSWCPYKAMTYGLNPNWFGLQNVLVVTFGVGLSGVRPINCQCLELMSKRGVPCHWTSTKLLCGYLLRVSLFLVDRPVNILEKLKLQKRIFCEIPLIFLHTDTKFKTPQSSFFFPTFQKSEF